MSFARFSIVFILSFFLIQSYIKTMLLLSFLALKIEKFVYVKEYFSSFYLFIILKTDKKKCHFYINNARDIRFFKAF